MTTSPLFSRDGAARSACLFAWGRAQECLWPFFAFAVGWMGVYGGLALALLVSSGHVSGFMVRVCAAAVTVFFSLWFSSVSLDAARGKEVSMRSMVYACMRVFTLESLLYACLSFGLLAMIGLPGILVMVLVPSMPFLTPLFSALLAGVSWLYLLVVVFVHANLGFVLVGSSRVSGMPRPVSWKSVREAVKTAWGMLLESRAIVEREQRQYAAVLLYGITAFVLGIIPSIASLGVGFVFLAFFFGIALARMYLGAHQVRVPVSRA